MLRSKCCLTWLVINKQEVQSGGSVHHQLAELRDMFAVCDGDGNGQLDHKDFLKALMAAAESMF